MPEALLPRTDRGALGLPRRGVDAVFRALDIVVLPGYAQPMVRVCDDVEPVEQSTYRKIVSGLGASSGSRGNPVRAATSNTSCRGRRCLSPAAEAEVTVDTGLLGRLGVRGGRCGLTALPRVPCPPRSPFRVDRNQAWIRTANGPTMGAGVTVDRLRRRSAGLAGTRGFRTSARTRSATAGSRRCASPASPGRTSATGSAAIEGRDCRPVLARARRLPGDRSGEKRSNVYGRCVPPCGRPRWKTPVLQGELWAAHAGGPWRRDLLGVRGVRAGRDGVARRAQGSLPGS